jgi:hypothetical protein
MRAAVVTESGAQDLANEDWAGVAPGLAVVLDGLSAPEGTEAGCRHGTPWYVAQLGPRLLTLASDPGRGLVHALAEAIRQVADLHRECDLSHPGTLSATVVLLRALDERIELRNHPEVAPDRRTQPPPPVRRSLANTGAPPSSPDTATRLGAGSTAPPPLGDLVEHQRWSGGVLNRRMGAADCCQESSRRGCGGDR